MEAETELTRSQEATAGQLLGFLTGLERVETTEPSDIVPPPTMESEETYAARVDRRPDVQTAREAWQVAKRQVLVAQGDVWPDVDVEANYYTKRVGAAEDIDWDVLLTVDVPLFQGGKVAGQLREALSRARQAKLELGRAQRAAALDVRQAYARLQGAIAGRDALAQALQAAEDNYRLQVEDYRVSLVNNLDVLQALQALQNARRDTLHAQYEAKRRYWQLRVAVGEPL